jgi:hypothetical protein
MARLTLDADGRRKALTGFTGIPNNAVDLQFLESLLTKKSLMMDWWNRCTDGHLGCRRIIPRRLPTRLLYLGKPGDVGFQLRLCDSFHENNTHEYLALSHPELKPHIPIEDPILSTLIDKV